MPVIDANSAALVLVIYPDRSGQIHSGLTPYALAALLRIMADVVESQAFTSGSFMLDPPDGS